MQLRLIIFLMVCVLAWPVLARDNLMRLYIDADNSISRQATESIYRGIYTALKERDFLIEGYLFEIVIRDHRGNSSRSKVNLEAFLKDDRGLLVFSGLHSPPLLANQSFINRQKFCYWTPGRQRRLLPAVKRRKTGSTGCRWMTVRPVSLSLPTQWILKVSAVPICCLKIPAGDVQTKNMLRALAARNLKAAGVSWFNWSLGQYNARTILRTARDSGADVIFLVANAPEGKVLLQAMAEDPSLKLPVRSHWGLPAAISPQMYLLKPASRLTLNLSRPVFHFSNCPGRRWQSRCCNKPARTFPM
ncbi:hypothetical protein [Aliamphritea spongicola]|nr:hypothetical protein [Aliamphritea spongicola]